MPGNREPHRADGCHPERRVASPWSARGMQRLYYVSHPPTSATYLYQGSPCPCRCPVTISSTQQTTQSFIKYRIASLAPMPLGAESRSVWLMYPKYIVPPMRSESMSCGNQSAQYNDTASQRHKSGKGYIPRCICARCMAANREGWMPPPMPA